MDDGIKKTESGEVKSVKEKTQFTKEQILKSEKYKNRVDLINALLTSNEVYSLSEIDELINKFMKGSVK